MTWYEQLQSHLVLTYFTSNSRSWHPQFNNEVHCLALLILNNIWIWDKIYMLLQILTGSKVIYLTFLTPTDFVSNHRNEIYDMRCLSLYQKYICATPEQRQRSYLISFSSRPSFVHNTCFKIFKISIQLFCNKTSDSYYFVILIFSIVYFLVLLYRLVSAQTYFLSISFIRLLSSLYSQLKFTGSLFSLSISQLDDFEYANKTYSNHSKWPHTLPHKIKLRKNIPIVLRWMVQGIIRATELHHSKKKKIWLKI